MPLVSNRTTSIAQHDERFYLDILSEAESGKWELRLPPVLTAYQQELELLLGKVFSGRPSSKENFALAQQLSLNWVFSKCRQVGMKVEECFAEAY